MDKITELSKEQKNEDKMLIANVLDKIKIVQKRNANVLDKIKIVQKRNGFENTHFLNMQEQALIENVLKTRNYENYEFFGGVDETERKMLFVYSEKIMQYESEKNKIHKTKIKCLNISLPKEEYGKYTHKTYLGAIIKLGVKREMIGDEHLTFNKI